MLGVALGRSFGVSRASLQEDGFGGMGAAEVTTALPHPCVAI